MGVLIWLAASSCQAQEWNPGKQLSQYIHDESGRKLKLSFEFRMRPENRTGVTLGLDPDYTALVTRTRVGMTWQPLPWLKMGGMMQDARVPGYGPGAPWNLRDPADLEEGYVEMHSASTGLGLSIGRMLLNYGEGRLIGVPHWSNVPRSFDQARLLYTRRRAQLELVFVSQIKIRPEGFNRPVLGDHLWGTYNSFPDLFGKNRLEFYILRHNNSLVPGTGVNTAGFRLVGPLPARSRYSLEGALQNGRLAGASHAAGAWYSLIGRQWTLAKRTLDISAEYKFASGTANPADKSQNRTFDQLFPANHDKFGHEDLFGWRNMHNVRSLTTYSLTQALAANFMYDSYWLASPRDAVYNGNGRPVVADPSGKSGRHVGQEFDGYLTLRFDSLLFGGGYARLVPGEFLRKTRPGVHSTFLYVFYMYSF